LQGDTETRLRYWAEELYDHNAILMVVYGANGEVRLRTQELAEDGVPASLGAVSAEPSFADYSLPTVGRQRVLSSQLSVASQIYTIRLMTSLSAVDHELAELLTAVLLAVPAAILISGAVGYLLARKALAPVESLRKQTRQITADRLDRRLPVANPEDELGRLAATINEMIGRLERSFLEVRRFTADASHELRTPLTALRAEIEAALRRPALPEEHQHLLGSILEECQWLTRLTDQLLTLSREDAGAKPRAGEKLDLVAAIRDVAETMKPLAEERGLHLQMSGVQGCEIHGNPARVRQVIYNLIDNGIKYTPAGGKIEIDIQRRDETAIVTVKDTGIGIAPEHLPRVFDRFYRVDKARSREQGGTGLGLSIAQSLIHAHGGTIELRSVQGAGTTCTIVLPLNSDESAFPTNSPKGELPCAGSD